MRSTIKLAAFCALLTCASIQASPEPEKPAKSPDNQFWMVSACLDDNTASECLEQYPEWADDPQLLDALREEVPGCITDTECESE